MTEHRDYMMPSEVAALFDVTPRTVKRWAKRGLLPYVLTLGGHRRYPRREIEAMHAERTQRADHEGSR